MTKYTACPVCGEPKKRKWNLCRDCLKIYGGAVDGWPEWLKILRNDTERLRYDTQQSNENEIPFNDFEYCIDQYWSDPEVLHTRPRNESRIVTDSYGSVSIPYAPYDDEEMNREYRKSNGIPDDLDTHVIAVF